MNPILIGGLFFAVAIALLISGLHIGLVLALAGVLGTWVILGDFNALLGLLKSTPYSAVAVYDLSVVPLFVIMGEFSLYGGISGGAYSAINHWVGRIRGGLAIATVWACAAFGATSGSSVAAASVFTKVAYPEMRKAGYDKYFSAGLIASASTLAMLIPPSLYMVIFGILAQQSVSKLLIAGFLPGVLTAFLLSVVIYIYAVRNPKLAPAYHTTYTFKERNMATLRAWPMLLLAAIIIGGIYSGIFTPTEAAAVGAFAAMVISLGQRKLTRGQFKQALFDTAFTTAMLSFVIIGASIFAKLMTISGMPIWMGNVIKDAGLSPIWIIVIILVIYGVLGCFIDALSIMFILTPIFAPILIALNVDMIWFGVLNTVILNLGTITPPFGLCVFTVKAIAGPDVSVEGVFKGSLFTYWAQIGSLAILILVPPVSTILPSLMFGGK
jgi:C4-dicarboxylate transporter DctM subunit